MFFKDFNHFKSLVHKSFPEKNLIFRYKNSKMSKLRWYLNIEAVGLKSCHG